MDITEFFRASRANKMVEANRARSQHSIESPSNISSGSSSSNATPAASWSNSPQPIAKKGQSLFIEGICIDFPLSPYLAQVQMMKKIIHALNNSENALLESPTGSGKSLAILCAALAWRENEEKAKVTEMIKQEKTVAKSIIPEIPNEGSSFNVMTINTKETEAISNDNSKNKSKNDNIILTKTKTKKNILVSTKKTTAEMPITIADDDDDDDFQPVNFKPPRKVFKGSIKKPENSSVKSELSSSVHTKHLPTTHTESSSIIDLKPATEKSTLDEVNNRKYQTYKQVPRIFVGSRTHKQITQLVSELKNNTRYKPRMTVLSSRDQSCIHPQVSKSNNKTEDCVNLLDHGGCKYSKRTHLLVNHSTLKTVNRVWDIEDLVILGKKVKGCPYYAARKMYEGAEVIFCPYNYILDPLVRVTLDINLNNSIVILDEAHNIEDAAMSSGSFEVDQQQLESVFKELGHMIRYNQEPTAHREIELIVSELLQWMVSPDIVYTIREFERSICHYKGQHILELLEKNGITQYTFNNTLKPSWKKIQNHAAEARKEAENRAMDNNTNFDNVPSSSQTQSHTSRAKCLSNMALSTLAGIFMVLTFLFTEGKNYEEDYRMVLMKNTSAAATSAAASIPSARKRRKKNDVQENNNHEQHVWTYKLGFWCQNPGIIFNDMAKDTKSVILTSGTLSPLDTFASELEVPFQGRLEADHVIESSQVWVGAATHGPRRTELKGVFSNMELFAFQDDIGQALKSIVETVPYGILFFMPSYSSLENFLKRFKTTGLYDSLLKRKKIFKEPKGSNKEDFTKLLNDYYEHVNECKHGSNSDGTDGALLLAVFRGKISEGIDFTDHYCRAVISVGIPFPAIKDQAVVLKRQYNDEKRKRKEDPELLSGNQWYDAQAYRAINQALGRCIRHKNDWGAIIMLEKRFANPSISSNLSHWVRKEHKAYGDFDTFINSLKQFVKERITLESKDDEDCIADTEPEVIDDDLVMDNVSFDVKVPDFDMASASPKPVQKYKNEPATDHSVKDNNISLEDVVLPPQQQQQHKGFTEEESPDLDSKATYSLPLQQDELKTMNALPSLPIKEETKQQFKVPSIPSAEQNVTHQFQQTPSLAIPLQRRQQQSEVISVVPEKNSSNTSSSSARTLIQCSYCKSSLFHGPVGISDLGEPQLITDLSCLRRGPSSSQVYAIQDIEKWQTTNDLQGRSIHLESSTEDMDVVYNPKDGVCYKLIQCSKCTNNAAGLFICATRGSKARYHEGRVYLWADKVRVIEEKNNSKNAEAPPIAMRGKRSAAMTDFHNQNDWDNIEFPSSQVTSMNDMFYSL